MCQEFSMMADLQKEVLQQLEDFALFLRRSLFDCESTQGATTQPPNTHTNTTKLITMGTHVSFIFRGYIL